MQLCNSQIVDIDHLVSWPSCRCKY